MTIKIKVTKDILERSKMCNYKAASNCAIALAVRDLFPKALVRTRSVNLLGYLGVNDEFVIVPQPDKSILPFKALDFILDFDCLSDNPELRVKLEPIEFELEIPDYVIEQIGISQCYKVLSESKTLEMVM